MGGGFLGAHWGSLASNSKGISRSMGAISSSIGGSLGSIGGGVGDAIGGILSPFAALEGQAFNQLSDFTSSPIMYIGLGLIGVVLLTSIFKAISVANNGIGAVRDNPELIAIAAQAAKGGL